MDECEHKDRERHPHLSEQWRCKDCGAEVVDPALVAKCDAMTHEEAEKLALDSEARHAADLPDSAERNS